MGKAIGIDFGTSNCRAAFLAASGKPVLLQSLEAEDFTPAAVCAYKGEIIVGRRALERMGSAPADTLVGVRRLLGRSWDDPETGTARARCACRFVHVPAAGDDDLKIVLGNQAYSPVEVAALILKKVKADAELRLNEPVEEAVITVPICFTERQRRAVCRAGELAGLRVVRLSEEPVAAAVALGVADIRPEQSRRVLVFDLGGGTLDVTLLSITRSALTVLQSAGDLWLGGEDFDQKIIDHVVQQVRKRHRLDPSGNPRFMAELKKRAEQAKRSLGNVSRTEISLMGLLPDATGQLVEVEVELTREQFERMIRPEVERGLALVARALEAAKCRSQQIDQVILAGGSTAIPLVRRALADEFGEGKILTGVEPTSAVAWGAARMAARTAADGAGREKPREEMPAPVTSHHLGVRAPGDRFEIIIPAGTRYPMAEPVGRGLLTPQAGLRRLRVPVYQGQSLKASENELQLTLWLELPPQVPARTPVDLAFRLNADGVLEVKAALRDGSGRPLNAYEDRGGDGRSRMELKLDRARRAWDAHHREALRRFEALYTQVIEALNAGDVSAAEQALPELMRVLEAVAAVSGAEGGKG